MGRRDDAPPATDLSPAELAAVGLCASCTHARTQSSARGRRFWRCGEADRRGELRRYPRLPVQACVAHVRVEPEGGAARQGAGYPRPPEVE